MNLLRELAGHPEYLKLLERAQELRPLAPNWNPKDENTDEWKHKSAMQEGFDLCLTIFAPGFKPK